MSFLLKLIWAVLLLCIIVLLGATIGLTLYEDEIEAKIADKVEQLTGRELRIREGFGFTFNPLPSIYAKDIVFANADWSTQPWMLKIEKVEAAFSFLALAQGKVQVAEINIESPYMLFERHQGSLNWFLGKSTGKAPKPLEKAYKYLLLNEAQVNNGVLDLQVTSRKEKILFNRILANVNSKTHDISLQVVGSANQRLIQATGLLTDVESLLLRKPSQLQLNGVFGQMSVNASGTVNDVLRWQGISLSLEAEAPSLQFFQPWNRLTLPDTPAIAARASFMQPKRWSTATLEQIEATMQGYGGKTVVVGEFTDLQNWTGLNLRGTSQHQLQPLLAEINWGGDEDAQINAEFVLQGGIHDGLSLNLSKGSMVGEGIRVEAKGEIDNLIQAESSSIVLKGQATSLDQLGAVLGRPWPKTSVLDGYAELAKTQGRFALKNIQISAYEKNLTASGEVQNIGRFATGNFSVKGKLNKQQIAKFNADNDRRFPEADEASVNATIRYADQLFSSPNTKVGLTIGANQVGFASAIDDMKTLTMRAAKLDVNSPDITAINALYDSKLPDLGHLVGNGQLHGSLESGYAIQDLQGQFTSANHRLSAQGQIDNLGPDMHAQLAVEFEAAKLDDLQDQLEFDLPQNMGAKGALTLSSVAANDWSAQDIQAKLAAPDVGVINGKVEHFPLQTQYDLDVELASFSIENVPQLASIPALADRSLEVSAKVTTEPAGKVFSAKNVNATITEAQSNAIVRVQGEVDDIAGFSGLHLNGQLNDGDLSQIPELEPLDLKPDLPFDIEFLLERDLASNTLNFTIGKLQLEQSNLSGELSFQLPTDNAVPYLSGRLQSDKLDVLALLKETERKRMFSDTPYSLEWAKQFNARIELQATELNGVIANIENAKMQIRVNEGLLTIPGLEGEIGEGNLTIWFALDATSKPYNMVSSMYGQGLDSKKLNLFGDSGLIKEGLLDVDLGVSGQGESLAQMMGNAYGKLQLQLHNASIKNQNLELFGSDLILGFLNTINPLSRQQKYLDIECGVIHFPINNGKAYADQGIAIKTDRVTVLGGGEINLRNEELKILIKPKARKGFGLSAGTIAKIVQIGGTIDKPKIEVATSGFFSAAAAIGMAAASGGWTLLAQGLLDRNKANSNVCNQTLKSPVFAAITEILPLDRDNLNKSSNK